MRKRLYEILEEANKNDKISLYYDAFIIITVFFSLFPLAFKESNSLFVSMDKITVMIFLVDYVLRWCTADYKYKKGILSFIRYPFGIMAIIDLISILPSIIAISSGLKILRAIRLLRIVKVFRYLDSIDLLIRVIQGSKDALIAVCVLAFGYIVVSALIIFTVEPDTFANFFDAIYWATVSLTTIGYGDLYPVTTIGRIITMLSTLIGVVVVSLPAAIITAGYMKEIKKGEE